ADDGSLRMFVGERRELPYGVPARPGVRVQEQAVPPGSETHPGVVAAAHSGVLLFDQARVGKTAPHDLERLVAGAVVDDDRLMVANALEAAFDPLRRIECDHNDGNV